MLWCSKWMQDSGVGCGACVETWGTWKLSVFSSEFVCEPKAALKNGLLIFKKYRKTYLRYLH